MDQLPGLDLAALRRHMEQVMERPPAGNLTGHLIDGGRSNLTYSVTDGLRRWVVRRPPRGPVPNHAHDVGRESRLMAALAPSAVPVPEVVLTCSESSVIGAPFYVMEHVVGVAIRSREDFIELTALQRGCVAGDLVDTLAKLHTIEPADVGLERLGRPQGYLERQIARWTHQYHGISSRNSSAVESLATSLSKTMPTHQRHAIVHGDYRLDNVLVDPAAGEHPITSVLDWEMATLGDPLVDLGSLISCWDEEGRPHHPITQGLMTLPGVPSPAEALERYAKMSGNDVDEIEWYITFNLFKLAIVLEQIHARDIRGETIGYGANGVGDLALRVLDQALATRP